MGLLTQAMAGMVSGAAGAGYEIMKENRAAERQSERDKALELKEMNLARFRANLDEEKAISKEKRTIEQEKRKDESTLTDYEVDGVPQTKGRVLEIAKQKREAEDIRKGGLLATYGIEGANETRPGLKDTVDKSMDMDADLGFGIVKKKSLLSDSEGTYTPEQQAIIDKADAIKLENAKVREKRLELQSKLEDKEQARRDQADLKERELQTRKEIASESNAVRREGQAERKSERQSASEKERLAIEREERARLRKLKDEKAKAGGSFDDPDLQEDYDKLKRKYEPNPTISKSHGKAPADTFAPKGQSPAPAQSQRPTTSLPAVGTIKNGYKFKGGDPSKQQNWVRVGG